MGQLLLGWSSVDITPERPVSLVGQFVERISRRVRDPLTATALALENGEEQAVMVSVDLIGVEQKLLDDLRGRLKPALPGLNPDAVFICATHTHTGPYQQSTAEERISGDTFSFRCSDKDVITPREYSEFLLDRLERAVTEAWMTRSGGSVSRAFGYAAVGHNRRAVYNDGTGRMYGDVRSSGFDTLEGPEDHGTELLYTWDAGGNLTGIVMNISCPSQVVECKDFISADYWGAIREKVREKYGQNVRVLALCGAAGDQSPRDLVRMGRTPVDMYEEEGLEEIASRVLAVVNATIGRAAACKHCDAALRHTVRHIDLPVFEVSGADYEKALRNFENSRWQDTPDDLASFERFLQVGCINRYRDQQEHPSFRMELHVIRLGDVAIATNPFELYLDYGLRIKALSRASQTFVVQLACDTGGYLPTEKAVAHGHYSAVVSSNLVGPEGGRLLVKHTVTEINSLWE